MPEEKMPITTEPKPANAPYVFNDCRNCGCEMAARHDWGFCSRRCKTEWSRNNREACESDPFMYLEDNYIEWEALLAYLVKPKSFRQEHGFPLARFIAAFKATSYFRK